MVVELEETQGEVMERRRSWAGHFLRYVQKLAQSREPAKSCEQGFAPAVQIAQAADHIRFRQMTFTFAVIALAAHMMKLDGPVRHDQFKAFCLLFPMPREEDAKIHRLFVMACREGGDGLRYARQIQALFPDQPELMTEVANRLCRLAGLDGAISAQAAHFLRQAAVCFGIRPQALPLAGEFDRDDPHTVLGVSPRAAQAEIKRVYRERIRQLHPDRLIAEGCAPEVVALAEARLAAINDAYRLLMPSRKSS